MVGEFGIRATLHDPQSDACYLAPRRDAGRQVVIDCVRGHARTLAEVQLAASGKWIDLLSGGDVSGAAQRAEGTSQRGGGCRLITTSSQADVPRRFLY